MLLFDDGLGLLSLWAGFGDTVLVGNGGNLGHGCKERYGAPQSKLRVGELVGGCRGVRKEAGERKEGRGRWKWLDGTSPANTKKTHQLRRTLLLVTVEGPLLKICCCATGICKAWRS